MKSVGPITNRVEGIQILYARETRLPSCVENELSTRLLSTAFFGLRKSFGRATIVAIKYVIVLYGERCIVRLIVRSALVFSARPVGVVSCYRRDGANCGNLRCRQRQ